MPELEYVKITLHSDKGGRLARIDVEFVLLKAIADHSQSSNSNVHAALISSSAALAHKTESEGARLSSSCLSLEPLDNV